MVKAIKTSKQAEKSIWGKGDKLTLKILKKLPLTGDWLDLAAGDGRYVPELLEKVDNLTLSDMDQNALFKVLHRIPKRKKFKIKTAVFDLTKKFPFNNKSFDGVFCTGALHLFPKKVLQSTFNEIEQVLKPHGMIILDFATDVKRKFKGKTPEYLKNVPKYKSKPAKQFLKKLLKDYKIKIYKSTFAKDLYCVPKYGFKSAGNFFLFVGKKAK